MRAFRPTRPGTNVQIACGTSLQAALSLGAKIATGELESGIAGGSDTVSDSPVVFGDKFQHRMIDLSRARTGGERLKTFKGFSFGELTPVAPSTQEPRTGLSMGEHCELMAKQWGITREAQDAFALKSHQNAAKAYDEGFHDDLIVACAGIVRDNNVRADTTLEKMATMKPAFDRKSGKGTLTAANSTPLTDGASSVLLASEDWAKARGLPSSPTSRSATVAANDFAGGDGLLMAPTIAVSDMLRRANLSFADIDLFEIHEAFAAQVLCTLKAWEDPDYNRKVLGRETPLGAIDPDKINVKGSSLAYGHPFAATGARILGLTAKLLNTEARTARCCRSAPPAAWASPRSLSARGVELQSTDTCPVDANVQRISRRTCLIVDALTQTSSISLVVVENRRYGSVLRPAEHLCRSKSYPGQGRIPGSKKQ